MTPEKLLQQILSGKKSIPFREFIKLAEAFGFVLDRVKGSHHIFKAERYGLSLEEKK